MINFHDVAEVLLYVTSHALKGECSVLIFGFSIN
jgi:hypothetical protein